MAEIYVSTDIETDGMAGGVHSMIQLGSVAVTLDGTTISEFSANLQPLPEATQLNSTMEWWAKRPQIYKAVTENPEPPLDVMVRYDAWLKSLPGNPVFVGYPVTFDYGFVWYYQWRFVGSSPFTHGALDIKTLAMQLLDSPTYAGAAKSNWPVEWYPPQGTHAHVAVEDAREQAYEFIQMMKLLRERNEKLRSVGVI